MRGPERTVVWGAGAWGTALALHLQRAGGSVALWVYEEAQFASMVECRENRDFLPGHLLPDSIRLFHDLREAPGDAAAWISVSPAQATRALWRQIGPRCASGTLVISASKGIERETLLPVSALIEEHLPLAAGPVVVLSGPSFAAGLAQGDPTAVVLASPDPSGAERAQRLLSHAPLRGYASTDRPGVELGGAVKNVIALACGMASGLGFGPNTVAALITRGLREIVRLGVAMGADPHTFSGLSGVGDLVLTCTGGESRNRTVGYRLGRGEPLASILGSMKAVAEGVPTTRSVAELARRHGVEMPITFVVERMLYEGLPPAQGVRELLSRDLKHEMAN